MSYPGKLDQADGLRRLLHAAPPEVLAVLPCGSAAMAWVTLQLGARASAGSQLLALEERGCAGNLPDCLGINPRFDLALAVGGELGTAACLCEAQPGLDVALTSRLVERLSRERIFRQRCIERLRSMRHDWDEWVVVARGLVSGDFSDMTLAAPRLLVALTADPAAVTAAWSSLKQIAARGGERHVSVCMVGTASSRGDDTLSRLCVASLQRLDLPLSVVSSLGEAMSIGVEPLGRGQDVFIERLLRLVPQASLTGARIR